MVSGDLTGRQIAELAAVPVVSASRVLADLAEIALVHARDVGQARIYRLNREHALWAALAAMMATAAIIEERIRSISLEKAPSETTVAIFGSFARGDAGLSSDIDIVIVSRDSAHTDARLELVDELEETIREMTGKSVNVIDILDEDLDRLVKNEDPLIESWSQDARTLHGVELTARVRRLLRA